MGCHNRCDIPALYIMAQIDRRIFAARQPDAGRPNWPQCHNAAPPPSLRRRRRRDGAKRTFPPIVLNGQACVCKTSGGIVLQSCVRRICMYRQQCKGLIYTMYSAKCTYVDSTHPTHPRHGGLQAKKEVKDATGGRRADSSSHKNEQLEVPPVRVTGGPTSTGM